MSFDMNNLRDYPDGEQGYAPEFRELLRSSDPADGMMSWNQIVSLVENAPPVHVPWYLEFLGNYQRQLRFAAAPLMIMLLIGGMWAMPAQSLNVGTTVISDLPADWTYNSPQFQELNTASRADFSELELPQSSMRLLLMPKDESQRLVMVLSGVSKAQAGTFYSSLQQQFPVLAAMNHELYPIETTMHENLLADVTARFGEMKQVEGLNDNQLSLLVKNMLDESGFTNVKLSVNRAASGRVQIEVLADYDGTGSQSELSLDELEEAGYDETSLGKDAYNTLNNVVFGVDTP